MSRSPFLPPEPPGDVLQGLMIRLCDHASADLGRIPDRPAENIHALRTRMKKMRAVLRLVESRLSGEKRIEVKAQIRNIKDAFGQSRDYEVLGRLAGKMAAKNDRLPQFELQPTSENVVDVSAANGQSLRKVRAQVHSLRVQIQSLDLDRLSSDDVAEAYALRYRACRRAMKRCKRDPIPENFHRWRKPVKELYYLSLVLHRRRDARKRIRPTKELGHWLGREHDLEILKSHLAPKGQSDWHEAIDKKLAKLRDRTSRKAAKLFRKRRREL